tara:strand:- start:1702 stop:2175 length:474 start_codon:yes stop_codon:yes gene_type:complete
MKKNNKKILIFLLTIFFFLYSTQKTFPKENTDFLSLRNNETNLRQGPSFEYPIKFTYKKKYLPVEILDRSETWVKIKDFTNNSGWIHISQLSKKKTAINKKKNTIIYKKPTFYSKPLARLEIGRLVLIKKCKIKWCEITSGKFTGWIFKNYLWGRIY